MPFPWKKVRSTKISQLFSDHLESHRRQRGHLVVETGFPTSLVDLFVKNRDRLKKPKSSKKKKKKKDQNIDNSSVLPSSLPSPSPSSSPLIPRAPCSSPLVLNLGVSSSSLAVNGGLKETHERPNAKGVLGAILRMSFVVVVALGAKKFAVGLLVSALLLFFVEFIGKKSFRYLEPCSGVKRRLGLIMQSIFLVIISFRNKSFDEKFNSDTGTKEEKLGSNDDHGDGGGGNPNCEIQIAAEPMFVGDGGGIEELPLPPLDQPSRGDGNKEEEREPKKGKRAKMKSKIKRLFPRKFRGGSKKEKRDLETETNPTRKEEEGIVPILDKEKEEEPNQNEQSISRRSTRKQPSLSLSPSTSTSTTQEGNDGISTICNSDEEINSDGIVTGEEGEEEEEEEIEEEERKGKNCCGCFTTCIIVLVGLTIDGKFLSLVFVVLWFLMLKSGEMLGRYIHTYI